MNKQNLITTVLIYVYIIGWYYVLTYSATVILTIFKYLKLAF